MKKKKRIPLRMCLGCRLQKDKRELMRVVRTPAGEIELDPTGRKAGRGAYICADSACLKKAIKGRLLEKSLQHAVPEEVVARLMKQIEDIT